MNEARRPAIAAVGSEELIRANGAMVALRSDGCFQAFPGAMEESTDACLSDTVQDKSIHAPSQCAQRRFVATHQREHDLVTPQRHELEIGVQGGEEALPATRPPAERYDESIPARVGNPEIDMHALADHDRAATCPGGRKEALALGACSAGVPAEPARGLRQQLLLHLGVRRPDLDEVLDKHDASIVALARPA